MKKVTLMLALLAMPVTMMAQKNFIDQAYINVTATADSLVAPDEIFVNIELSEAKSKNKIAVEQQEIKLINILQKLNPNIDWKKNLSLRDAASNHHSSFWGGKQVIKTKNYELKLSSARELGLLMSAFEREGMAGIRVIRVDYSKKEELKNMLRQEAIRKSKYQAQNLAMPLGQRVGKAIYIEERQDSSYYPVAYSANKGALMTTSATEEDYASLDVDFEKLKFETFVTVNYTLE